MMRHRLIGFAALPLGAALALGACAAPTVSSSPTPTPATSAAAPSTPAPSGRAGTGSPSAGPVPSAVAGVGDTIELSGLKAGERMAVTLVQVVDPAQPASEFDSPPAGSRLISAQVRLRNTGTGPYQDSPANSATLVDTVGQAFRTTISGTAEGPAFPGSVTVAPGDTGLGFVTFAVPAASVAGKFQFALDSGLATEVGQWRVTVQPGRPPSPTPTAPPSTSTSPSPSPAPPSAGVSAAQTVRAYYTAVNAGDYTTAWALGGQNLTGSYQDFVDGFATTRYDTLTVVSEDGPTVQVALDAEQTDGSHRYYAGSYTVRNGAIVAAAITPR
jgi:hypothetical protein